MGNRRHAALAGTAVAALALVTAGCGDGDSYSGGTSRPAGGSSSLAPGSDGYGSGDDYGSAAPKAGDKTGDKAGDKAGAKGEAAKTLAVRNVSGIGSVVTDSKGAVLYRFDKDTAKPPKSACDGDCAKAWPAVPADDATASAGIAADQLGRVVRADGTAQLTLAGWPVYRYAKDVEPGVAEGQGMGGTWHALAPDGKKAGAGSGAKPAGKAAKEGAGVALSDNAALGKILTDGQGRTLYRFNKDSAWPMRFGCTGACLDTWKPAKPADKTKLTGIPAKLISTVTRPDGVKQLAVDCWPVYWFTGDKKPGDVDGQGKMGLWFAVSGAGKKVTKAATATGY
ncbi:SCO0930 family lipoprotein [Streptomyces sp. NPDC050610]|uniref:SCO0930 family lipoprotein n=1 Tax=Streptomyces sp. NPDC050610 TaxID=3157097 RepID=UPI00341A11AC